MAFGRSETDALYDNIIKPSIENISGKPYRIDKTKTREWLNQKIVTQVSRCDMMIADLTFTRPSVYFEAGLAEGQGKPVIYTCRSDHLQRGNAEPNVVHFDLDKKEIEQWSGVHDTTFKRELGIRLAQYARPLLQERSHLDKLRQARKEYQALSESEKQTQLVEVLLSTMRKGRSVQDKVGYARITSFKWKGPNSTQYMLPAFSQTYEWKHWASTGAIIGLENRTYAWLYQLKQKGGPVTVIDIHLGTRKRSPGVLSRQLHSFSYSEENNWFCRIEGSLRHIVLPAVGAQSLIEAKQQFTRWRSLLNSM